MVVNGWSKNGLEFSRKVRTSQERDAAIKDARCTPHVTDVTVDYVKGGE